MLITPELYERVGIKWFKKWLPSTGDLVRRRFGITAGGMEGADRKSRLENVISATKTCEVTHLGITAILGIEQGVLEHAVDLGPTSHAFFGVMQVAINGYPIMLQRYNRLRARRALGRLAQAPTTQSEPSRVI